MYCFNFLFYKENTFKYYLGHLKNVQLYTSHWESRYLGLRLSLLKADPQESQLEFKALQWEPRPPSRVPSWGRGLPTPSLLLFCACVGIANGHSDPSSCPERSMECFKWHETFLASQIALCRDAITPSTASLRSAPVNLPRVPWSVSENDSGRCSI